MRQLTFQRVLGSGAFGSVYLAELLGRRGFRRQVAVKVLLENHPDGDVFVARVRDEARLLGLLQDEHILKVLELVRVQGRDAVMMEFVEGVDLAALISATEPPPPRALAELGASVAGALHGAHNARHPSTGEALNVIHRDVKPANVMITDRGGVKLLDFGVAQARFAARESKTGQFVLGTLNYMAPEYIITGEVRPAADIYGLALTLWEAAAGEVFGQPKLKAEAHAKRVEERLLQIGTSHAELVPVLREMLAWDPSSRPDGQSVERQLVSAADLLRGTGLRSWAGSVVPRALEKVRQTANDAVGLVGQVINIADEDSPTISAMGTSGGKPTPEKLPDEATMWGSQRPPFLDSPPAAPASRTYQQSHPPAASPVAAQATPRPVALPPAPGNNPISQAPPAYKGPGSPPPALANLSASRSVVPGSAPEGAAAARSGLRAFPPPSPSPNRSNETIMPEPEPAPPVVGRVSVSNIPAPVDAHVRPPSPKPSPAKSLSPTPPKSHSALSPAASAPGPTRPAPRKKQKVNIGWIIFQGLIAGALVGMFLVIAAILIFLLAGGLG